MLRLLRWRVEAGSILWVHVGKPWSLLHEGPRSSPLAGLEVGEGSHANVGSGYGTQLRGRDGRGALREWETHRHQILAGAPRVKAPSPKGAP